MAERSKLVCCGAMASGRFMRALMGRPELRRIDVSWDRERKGDMLFASTLHGATGMSPFRFVGGGHFQNLDVSWVHEPI